MSFAIVLHDIVSHVCLLVAHQVLARMDAVVEILRQIPAVATAEAPSTATALVAPISLGGVKFAV